MPRWSACLPGAQELEAAAAANQEAKTAIASKSSRRMSMDDAGNVGSGGVRRRSMDDTGNVGSGGVRRSSLDVAGDQVIKFKAAV